VAGNSGVPDRPGEGHEGTPTEQLRDAQRAQTEYIKSVAGGASKGATEQIASAKALLDSGAITQAEFNQLKAQALA
jgi:hypothetical protein